MKLILMKSYMASELWSLNRSVFLAKHESLEFHSGGIRRGTRVKWNNQPRSDVNEMFTHRSSNFKP